MPSLLRGSLPKIGPVKIRTAFEFRHLPQLGFADTYVGAGVARSLVVFTLQENLDPFLVNPPSRPTGDVEVSDNGFQGTQASLFVGPFELASNRDFVVAGAAGATATNIAAAISNLPGYDATAAGAVVTVEGPAGAVGDRLRFRAAYRGGVKNFTFTFVGEDDKLGFTANNPLRPPTILP